MTPGALVQAIRGGHRPAREEALALAEVGDLPLLMPAAAHLAEVRNGTVVTYSRKVFLPLTHACRDVCHYCTFARPPRAGEAVYLSRDELLEQARRGAAVGCTEALFTLGDKPEDRYPAARQALAALGHETTLSYLREAAELVHRETGLLPHLNPGVMTSEDLRALRPVSVSMGLMLESASPRLLEEGGPHHGSPDKAPSVRIETMRLAGEARIPFTSGILLGIGETRRERIEALLLLRDLADRHGHLQEVIVQPFRPKAGTRMANAPGPSLDDLLWTLAVARLVLGPGIAVQSPPNLSPGVLPKLVAAGIDDWGGVSPVTPDFVNPEAPWPSLAALAEQSLRAGKTLVARLPIYPAYTRDETWVDHALRPAVLQAMDAEGFARDDAWSPGAAQDPPALARGAVLASAPGALSSIVSRAQAGHELDERQITRLFAARGPEALAIYEAADALRAEVAGPTVTYVVTRNINYTNVCSLRCAFCAFSRASKGSPARAHAGDPHYDLGLPEIGRRAREAWDRGATEVCLQGGIHPRFTGQTYLDIVREVKRAAPALHVHAFSPLEIWHGARTLDLPLDGFLGRLVDAGLGSLPGTAAEILDDEVRDAICPDKLDTGEWLRVMETAHRRGLRTTATIMFGHLDAPKHWARHLLALRRLQGETGGFTEMVPLPFVHMEAPLYAEGRARRGPTFRESLLMHAVARLVLHPSLRNVQVSWVKMGPKGAAACLTAGANDLGGTLMNESISRAAGAAYGQELDPASMEAIVRSMGRVPRQRTTLYGTPPPERVQTAHRPPPLLPIVHRPLS